MKESKEKRAALVRRLFPQGIDKLWCPMIVQYGMDGSIDTARMEAHLQKMLSSVRSFLVFGSTGDGWELSGQEKRALITAYGDWVKRYGIHLLLGVLQPEMGASYQEMLEWIDWAKTKSGRADATEAMAALGVCGFTVCAPKGANLSQEVIERELKKILDVGVPVAIYQLPQITENEIAPETLEKLAREYPNFFLFKDTSGEDHVLLSGLDFGGVFFVRGAEGEYRRWYRGGKASYDGFLLSSANCFGDELLQMLERIDGGQPEEADRLSATVARVMDQAFAHTGNLAGGNVFANANKCIDHCQAWGEKWKAVAMPTRHCGQPIPEEYVAYAAELLQEESLFPAEGYLGGRA